MFELGQRIKFKDAAGGGEVCKVQGNAVWVKDAFGFETQYDASELLLDGNLPIGDVLRKDEVNRPPLPEQPAQRVDRLVIDLHSHELIESTHGMTRYEILSYQLDRTRDLLHEARRRRVPRVLIIHGKGSGRLQQEVHDLLHKWGGLEYYFADFSEGGYGATEVRFLSAER